MSKHITPVMLSLPATAAKLTLGETTLRRLMAGGEFVTPVQVAPRRIAFVESEVDAWLASRPRGPLPAPRTANQSTINAKEI